MNTQNFTQLAQESGFKFLSEFREMEGSQVAHIQAPKGEEYIVRAFENAGQMQFQMEFLANVAKNAAKNAAKKFMLKQAELQFALRMLAQNATQMMGLKQKGIGLMAAFEQGNILQQTSVPMPPQGSTRQKTRRIYTPKGIKEFITTGYEKIRSEGEATLKKATTEVQQKQQQEKNQEAAEQNQQQQNQQNQQQQQRTAKMQAKKPKKESSKMLKYLTFGVFGGGVAGVLGGSVLYTSLFGK